MYAVLENRPFSTKTPLMSAFFAKNQHFWKKNSTFTQSNSMGAGREGKITQLTYTRVNKVAGLPRP